MSGTSGWRTPKHVFWISIIVVTVPFILFVVLSYLRFDSVVSSIEKKIELSVNKVLQDSFDYSSPSERLAFVANSRVALERDIVVHRHSRSVALLVTRTWMRFMSLVFGTVLVVIGSVFVISKITTEPTETELAGGNIRVALVTSSPGLLLVLLGCLLIAVPNVSQQAIRVVDAPTYLLPTDENAANHAEADSDTSDKSGMGLTAPRD